MANPSTSFQMYFLLWAALERGVKDEAMLADVFPLPKSPRLPESDVADY
jgi:hypothetical protein